MIVRLIFRMIVLVFLVGLICCSNAKLNVDLKKSLRDFSIELSSMDSIRIKKITTQKGFESIMKWSDSLRYKDFVNHLAKNCKELNVFDVTKTDSVIYLSLGKSDEIIGATGGYLNLRIKNSAIRIDEYRGGK